MPAIPVIPYSQSNQDFESEMLRRMEEESLRANEESARSGLPPWSNPAEEALKRGVLPPPPSPPQYPDPQYSDEPAMDPGLFKDLILYGAENDNTKNNFATDALQGAFGDIPAAGMDFLKKKAGQLGNFLLGAPPKPGEDPKTLDGRTMPGGMNPDLFNANPEYRKRYIDASENW